jgi:hypothetical protein
LDTNTHNNSFEKEATQVESNSVLETTEIEL